MNTLIAGMGRSGHAVAKMLQKQGHRFWVFDANPNIGDWGQEGAYQTPGEVDWDKMVQCVVSPGIAFQHPVVHAALARGIKTISEIEFAYQNCQGPVVAVTGSNGKSSTVTMIESIFRAAGRSVKLCGNIGTPFTQAVLEAPEAVFVVEVSSFQLETIQRFRPNAAIILNITPDHLDRHGSFEAYAQAKLRIFENQGPQDWALVPDNFEYSLPGKARRIEVGKPLEKEKITLTNGEEITIDNEDIASPHQMWNARFAAQAAQLLGVEANAIQAGLQAFRGLFHRMEVVGTVTGRVWINDSKATNTDSTQVALDAMENGFVLILGGKNKDADFSALKIPKHLMRGLVLYGKAAKEIGEALHAYNPVEIGPFRDACLHAWALAEEGDTILLSPGCASFDQFDNFEKRGDAFKALFKEVKKSEAGLQ